MSNRKYFFGLFLFISFLLFPYRLNAQEGFIFSTHMGIHSSAIRDLSMSPMIYNGAGFSAGASMAQNKKNKDLIFTMGTRLGKLYSRPENVSNLKAFHFKNYTLYRSESSENIDLAAGWSNNNTLAVYNQESFSNFGSRFYYFTSFGPAVKGEMDFSLFNRTFAIRLLTDLQLVGFYLRPSYVHGAPEGYLDPSNSAIQAIVNSIELLVPWRAVNAGADVGICYYFKSGNSITLSYQYEFTTIGLPERVSASNGIWYFTLSTLI